MKNFICSFCLLVLLSITSKAFSQNAPNTNCSGAYPVTLGVPLAASSDVNATSMGPASSCGGSPEDDTWFYFTAPATGRVTIQLTNQNIVNPCVQVLSGACNALVPVDCYEFGNNLADYMYVANLVPSQKYYVRIYSFSYLSNTSGSFTLKINSAPQPPANDECTDAVNIPLKKVVAGTTIGASGPHYYIGDSPCFGGWNDDDVWYKFTATQNGTVSVHVSASFSASVRFYNGTCGNFQNYNLCGGFGDPTFSGVVAGQTYYFAVYSREGSFSYQGNFQVSVYGPGVATVANDDCSGALQLTPTNNYMLAGQSTALASPSYPSGCDYTDVWYQFYAPNTNPDVSIILDQTSENWSIFVYKGGAPGFLCDPYNPTATEPANINQTVDANQILGLDVEAGNYYYIRVQHRNCNQAAGTFRITVNDPTLRPNNDNCTGARTVTYNTTLTAQNNLYATGSPNPVVDCNGINAGAADDDVWYKFTVPAGSNGTLVRVKSTNGLDPVMFLYGSCGGTPIQCANTPGTSEMLWLRAGAIPAGTYYLRLYTWAPSTDLVNGKTLNFEVTAKDSAYAFNDEPCTPGVVGYGSILINQTTTGSTKTTSIARPTICSTDANGAPLGTGTTGNENDVWYKFNYLPTAGNGMVITVTSTNFTDPVFFLYSGTDCNNLTQVSCSNTAGNERLRMRDITAGTAYWVRIHEYSNNPMTFNINVKDTVFAVNDRCDGAIDIPFGTTLTNQNNDNTTGPIVLQSACAGPQGFAEDDSWYSFTPTGTVANIVVTSTNFTDPVLFVYNVNPAIDCHAGGTTILTCANTANATSESTSLTGLTAGKEYFIRVYDAQIRRSTFTVYAGAATLPKQITSLGNGDWNNAATWSCNCIPQNIDEVTIKAGSTINITAAMGILQCTKLIVEKGGKLNNISGQLKIVSD